jgi:hypothetical protein
MFVFTPSLRRDASKDGGLGANTLEIDRFVAVAGYLSWRVRFGLI